MSHQFYRSIGRFEVRISVNSDWSGDADVYIEDHSVKPYRVDRATCPAMELVVGDLHTVGKGSLNTVEWMMAAALAAHSFAVWKMRESLDRLA